MLYIKTQVIKITATDDGVNLHFIETKLNRANSDTPNKNAYHIYLKNGSIVEDKIEPILLKE